MGRMILRKTSAVLLWAMFVASGAAVFGLAPSGGVTSAQAADELAGKVLALRWCAACHLVSEDQPSVSSTSLPSFYDISADPEWTEDRLATFLVDPHPAMPDMNLGNIEITSLKQ